MEDLIIQNGICFFVPFVLFLISSPFIIYCALFAFCLYLTIILLILDLAELQIHQLEMQKLVSRAGQGYHFWFFKEF